MAGEAKEQFLNLAAEKFGRLKKLAGSQSLFETSGGVVLYIRYSAVHGGKRTFYGLRKDDLDRLSSKESFLCFLWSKQKDPLAVPYEDFREVIAATEPASDGQYKVQVYLSQEGPELYIAQAGRFSLEGYYGWERIEQAVGKVSGAGIPELSHSQVQTLLGAIGNSRGYGIWVPQADRNALDWALTDEFRCCDRVPPGIEEAAGLLQEIDVAWIRRGGTELLSLFEVEHSTPIYSGLLRLNDILLSSSKRTPVLHIVASDARRGVFTRQVNRPTFRASGLNRSCVFLEYYNVYGWYMRVAEAKSGASDG